MPAKFLFTLDFLKQARLTSGERGISGAWDVLFHGDMDEFHDQITVGEIYDLLVNTMCYHDLKQETATVSVTWMEGEHEFCAHLCVQDQTTFIENFAAVDAVRTLRLKFFALSEDDDQNVESIGF